MDKGSEAQRGLAPLSGARSPRAVLPEFEVTAEPAQIVPEVPPFFSPLSRGCPQILGTWTHGWGLPYRIISQALKNKTLWGMKNGGVTSVENSLVPQ